MGSESKPAEKGRQRSRNNRSKRSTRKAALLVSSLDHGSFFDELDTLYNKHPHFVANQRQKTYRTQQTGATKRCASRASASCPFDAQRVVTNSTRLKTDVTYNRRRRRSGVGEARVHCRLTGATGLRIAKGGTRRALPLLLPSRIRFRIVLGCSLYYAT